jgi:hypothetical protein
VGWVAVEAPETSPFRILFKLKFVPILVAKMSEYEEYVIDCFEKEAKELMKKWGIKESV